MLQSSKAQIHVFKIACFCPKNNQFIIIQDKKKEQILTIEKLKLCVLLLLVNILSIGQLSCRFSSIGDHRN